jgi:hypothetical protein
MPEQRYVIYQNIHKAIRHIMYSTALSLGTADFRDQKSSRETLEQLGGTITLLQEHAEHEETFVHPDLESRVPGITKPFDENHKDDDRLFDRMRELGSQIEALGDDAKTVALGNQLYGIFNTYISDYLDHLDREEAELEQALWDNFTDEELADLDHRLIGSIPPERMAVWVRVICNSWNASVLTTILAGMKQDAPPEAFAGMLQMVEQATPAATWETVRRALS